MTQPLHSLPHHGIHTTFLLPLPIFGIVAFEEVTLLDGGSYTLAATCYQSMSASPLLHSLPCRRAFAALHTSQTHRLHGRSIGLQRLQKGRSSPCNKSLQQPCRAQKKGFGSSKTRSRRVGDSSTGPCCLSGRMRCSSSVRCMQQRPHLACCGMQTQHITAPSIA